LDDGSFLSRGYFGPNIVRLEEGEFKEVRQAIINMVKKNPQQWRVEE